MLDEHITRPSISYEEYPFSHSHLIKEEQLNHKKAPYIGLCMNNLCSSNPRLTSKIKFTKYTKGFRTSNKRMIDCPQCKTALYWTNDWNQINE